MAPALDASSDNRLLERCRNGDAEAFGDVYDRYGRALFGTALRLLGRPDEAEDVVQEAFLKLHTRPPQGRVGSLGGWLHRVATNAALDRLRRRGRWNEQPLPERPLSTELPRSGGARMDLEAAVAELPERSRAVFVLHDVEGFKHREIAELLEISPGTSKSQLSRARVQLRRSLGAALPSPTTVEETR